jgi:hypothetical protein
MIPFAITNRERGMMGIHSFHDPAQGLTSVGLNLIFYCIMKLNETLLMHVHCTVCTVQYYINLLHVRILR